MYGPLTVGQFDDLERLGECEIVSLADFEHTTRKPESVVRAMSRYEIEGWVVSAECVETWRLTRRGEAVLRAAYDHMDTMVSELESEGEWL